MQVRQRQSDYINANYIDVSIMHISMLLVVDKSAFILFHIFRVHRYLLYCVILFPPSGLQEAKGLHSHTGTNAQHLRRLLENGVGTELGCHSDDNQTGGKNQGKKW